MFEAISTPYLVPFDVLSTGTQHPLRRGGRTEQTKILILKFWLHISCEEQRERFTSGLEEPEKHRKASEADVRKHQHWDD